MMMMMMMMPSLLICLLFCFIQVGYSSNTPPIIVRGNKLYNSVTGERFVIKGITYEYAMDDAYFTKYGFHSIDKVLHDLKGKYNALRLYNINPNKGYSKLMAKLAELGIYVMPAATPNNNNYFEEYRYATMRKDLGPTGNESKTNIDVSNTCYPAKLLEFGKKVIANFAQYDNTLAIVTSNEIMQQNLKSAACAKQYISDLKLWMRFHQQHIRLIPLAYAAADSTHSLSNSDADAYDVFKVQGLLCGDRQMNGIMFQSVDIFLLNTYRWRHGDTFETAFRRLVDWAQGAPIVLALGEYGARDSSVNRDWGMIPYMYGAKKENHYFDQIFSGGFAYSYGFSDLPSNSLFPFIYGGGSKPTDFPGSSPTVDYINLVTAFKNTKLPTEVADWKTNQKCHWAPNISVPSSKAPSVIKHGWIVKNCSRLSLAGDGGTWKTTSRHNVVCNDKGAPCDIDPSKIEYPTSQAKICESLEYLSGGAPCTINKECGNGTCIGLECHCMSCFSGPTCKDLDVICANSITSLDGAPYYIFLGTSSFAVLVILTFIALFVEYTYIQKERKAHWK